MASPTYTVRAIVLRKTRLGESDLIFSLLAEDGSRKRVVAKGARKPTSSFASRLELYCVVELLCAKGRSLDIVKEARLVDGHGGLRSSMEHAAGAACMCELLERITEDGLAESRLFEMSCVALGSLERAEARLVPFLTAAHLVKALSLVGLRPSLRSCVCCGNEVDIGRGGECANASVMLSVADGGLVCGSCASGGRGVPFRTTTVLWLNAAITSTFAALADMTPDEGSCRDMLLFCKQWAGEHASCRLKSLEFLLSL